MPNTAKLGIEIVVDDKGIVKLKNIGTVSQKAGADAAKGFDGASKSLAGVKSIAGEVGDAIKSLGPVIVTYFGAQAAKAAVSLADEMTTLNGRVKAVTSSSEEYAAVSELIYRQAQDTGTNLQANIESFAGLSMGMKDLGITSSEVLTINDAVNKSLLESNATQEQVNSFKMQFVQAMQSGVTQGEEFRAMMESNAVFAQKLAHALDTDIAGLRAMSSAGELTTAVIRKAMPQMTAEINAAFDDVPMTISRAQTQISNAFAKIISDGDAVTGGTNRVALSLSSLAGVAEQNAPAFQAMFTVAITGAEYAVKGVSALEGTIKAVAASALALSGGIYEVVGAAAKLTDSVGLTTGATNEWKISSEAAYNAANDLADQSNAAFQRMRGGIEQNITKEEEYRNSLEKNLASIEADSAAQEARAGKTVASIDKITKAEEQAAAARAKTVEEMYKTLGVGGEEYFRNEAQKLLDQAKKWEEAGADKLSTEQYLYEKITELSTQAWADQDQASGQYLDDLVAGFTAATDNISGQIEDISKVELTLEADTSSVDDSLAATAAAASDLGGTAVTIPVDADTESADSGMNSVAGQASDLSSTSVVVPIDADTSEFDAGAERVQSALDGFTGGGSGVISVDMESVEQLESAIERVEGTLMDPFGDLTAKYKEKIEEVKEYQTLTNNELAAEAAETAAEEQADYIKRIEDRKSYALELYKEQADAQKEADDAVIESMERKLDMAVSKSKDILSAVKAEADATAQTHDIQFQRDELNVLLLKQKKLESELAARAAGEQTDADRLDATIKREQMEIQIAKKRTAISEAEEDLRISAMEREVETSERNGKRRIEIAQQEADMRNSENESWISQEEYGLLLLKGRAMDAADAVDRTKKSLHSAKDALKDFEDGTKSFGDTVANVGASPFVGMFSSLLNRGMNSGLFRGAAFADGGIMTGAGAVELKKYSSGGIASTPQLAMFGEGDKPEAYVPLPDGRTIPVTLSAPKDSGGYSNKTVNNNTVVNINVTQPMTPNQIVDIAEKQKILDRRVVS